MDYIVSIENTRYFHWQIELLIESFRKHGIEDKLLICLAEGDNTYQPDFCRNLFKHKRVFAHENLGRIRGFPKFNRLYTTLWAVQSKLISQPFTLIEPDVLLVRPVDEPKNDFPMVRYAPDLEFTTSLVDIEMPEFWTFLHDREFYESRWVAPGSAIVFNSIPEFVFDQAVVLAEELAVLQVRNGREIIWDRTDKLAWTAALADHVGASYISQSFEMAMTLLDGYENANFIHYQHGMGAKFNKSQFRYLPPHYIAMGNPFKSLADDPPTPAAAYASEIAKAVLKNGG